MKKFKVFFDLEKKNGLWLYEAATECGVCLEEVRSEMTEDNIISFLKSFKTRLADPDAPVTLVADSLSILSTISMQARLKKLNITLGRYTRPGLCAGAMEHLLSKFKQSGMFATPARMPYAN